MKIDIEEVLEKNLKMIGISRYQKLKSVSRNSVIRWMANGRVDYTVLNLVDELEEEDRDCYRTVRYIVLTDNTMQNKSPLDKAFE